MSGKSNTAETRNVVPMLVEAFAAFNRSADKLSKAYRQLMSKVPGQESHACYPLPRAHQLLLGTFECIPSGVIVIDHECSAIVFNSAARRLTGLSKDDVIDKLCPDVLQETLTTATPGYCRKCPPSGIEVEIYTTPVADDNGNIIGAVGVIKDELTGLKAASLGASRVLGESGGRLPPTTTAIAGGCAPASNITPVLATVGDIIINIAHRMRSPLSAIQLFAEVLKQDLDPDKREIVDDILVGVYSLDAVLSNLLSFAQPVKPHFQDVDLAAVLDESLLFAAPAIKQQAVSLFRRYSHDKLYCRGDLEQLKQVFFNLILNAIQAMPEGGELHINASFIHEAAARKCVNVEIQDNGCGITDESMDRIFTPFFTTKEGGTGLGLCVVYRVIQAHGGSIRINSTCGHGTIVSVHLPTE